MNVSSLEAFKKEVNLIREYIKHIQYVNDIVDCNILEKDNEPIKMMLNILKEHYGEFRIGKKVFEYKAVIISLYGLLEKYVELWIKEYLDTLCSIVPEYNKIDERIRETHFELSLKLISTIINRENAKYQHLSKEEILKKLNNCIVNPKFYQLNTDAFVLLSGNLKHKKIVELFKAFNVDLNNRLRINQTLTQHIQDEQQKENIAGLNQEILYNKINDLVDRRNEIAHGSEEAVNNILDPSEIEKYIQFLEKYCQAVFEIINEELIKQESLYKYQKIKKIIDVFNSKILAFEIENHEIKVGDTIIIRTAEGRLFKKTVLEIQKDKKPYSQLKIGKKADISVRLEPNIKKNQEFFIKKFNEY